MSTLLRRDGLFPSPTLLPALDLLSDDFFNRDLLSWNDRILMPFGSSLPSVNIEETPTAFEIYLAAPGLKKDDFRIELKDNILTISSFNTISRKTHKSNQINLKLGGGAGEAFVDCRKSAR